MNFINRDQFLGVIRHIVTFVGGILVARGKLDVGSVETLAGIVSTVAGLVLSFVAPEKTIATTTETTTTEVKKA